MGKFAIKRTDAGVHFNLLATNGQVIGTSETYSSDKACLNGIESVKKNCVGGVENQTVEGYEVLKHPKFEVYQGKSDFRFRLKAINGQIILVSQGYKELKSCLNGVESVKKNAPDAPTVEVE